jgi:outer membrane murein-binding lipoprotein Lpp
MLSAVRRPRHRTALALAAAAVALPLTVGCAALDKAMDCANTASTIATSVDKLQQAVTAAANDPAQSKQALNDIDRELKALGDKTGNADLSKAVKDLTAGVSNVRKAIETGDTSPELKPITDAATEIGKVCTPG